MDRKHQLSFCRICTKRSFTPKEGIICSLTNAKADFENECPNFDVDQAEKEKRDKITEEYTEEQGVDYTASLNIDENVVNSLKLHQDYLFAVIGGLLSAGISAILWAVITVGIEFQIGYMAIGVGLLVGFTVRFFGAGIDKPFGFIGAVFALLGCIMGNLFSLIGFIAQAEGMGAMKVVSLISLGELFSLYFENMSPIDLLFYGIAVYEGYRFAFRKITVELLASMQEGKSDGEPVSYKLRTGLSIVSFIAIATFFFSIKQGHSGTTEFHYESGNIMASGNMHKGALNGKWTYYYEDGNLQAEGFFNMGLHDSTWTWYNEDQKIQSIGNYKAGIEHGIWMSYYSNGNLQDSGRIEFHRNEGIWKTFYESGRVKEIINYSRGKREGLTTAYYENDNIQLEVNFKQDEYHGELKEYNEQGNVIKEVFYNNGKEKNIINIWNAKKNKYTVKNGNGSLTEYYDNGAIMLEGQVKNGERNKRWLNYYQNGKTSKIGSYINNEYSIEQAFDMAGKPTIIDGNGKHTEFDIAGKYIIQEGEYLDGKKTGLWKTYYAESDKILSEENYFDGQTHGTYKQYFKDGTLALSGNMENGKKSEVWTWYTEDGVESSMVRYENDKKEGVQNFYNSMGTLVKKEHYSNGELINEEIEYLN